ncbi:hypothetical protein KKB54_05355 [bacterium]|nr:hypothetical protein [bacterium]MBU0900223.1 hypothetical protein [bacterium]MBU1153721.1 hypothetical protein [bacterium]MBU2598964.1 hypothetical protein [bacterium]
MEENKLSYYLACLAFSITGVATFINFLNTMSLVNLVLLVLFKSTVAYFVFKYLGLGIEKLWRWKIPQLYNPEVINQGKNIDLTMPLEVPKNNLNFTKERKKE